MKQDGLVLVFTRWAGWRLAGGLALALTGAAVEGIGLLMLVPVVGMLLGDGTATGFMGSFGAWLPTGPEGLPLVLAVFAALILVRFVVLHARNVVLARLEQGYVAAMRRGLFERLASAPWRAAAELAHGRIAHALSRNVDRAAQSVSALLRGLGAGVLLVVQAGIALWLSPGLTVLVAGLSLVLVLCLGPLRRRAARLGQEMTLEDYQLFSTTTGFLGGLKAAKAHGLEADYLDRFSRAADSFSRQVVAVNRDLSLAMLALQTGAAILAIGAVWLGHGWFQVPAESLVVILVLMVRLSAPLQALQATALALRHGEAAWTDAQRLLVDLPSGTRDEAEPWPTAPGFALSGVARAPDPNATPVLHDLSAEIPAGTVTAITGPSGSGKTTLCDLLAGLDTPDAGKILIDGAPLDARTRARLGPALAYVGQNPVPLQATLRESLTWGVADTKEDEIWQALETVGATQLVRELKDGLDTELRLDGSHFSGGERQRFALARALLRRPKLMILDEATNALDMAAEEQVLRALFSARQGATVIMVSHRPATSALATYRIAVGPAADAPRVPPASPPGCGGARGG